MQTVISKDRTTITYEKTGHGPLVILVGGAFNTRTFGPNASLAPVLAREFLVVNYDRRGRGTSGNTQPYAIEREVEDIEALIDAEGGTAFVYGISSGAALALEAANRLRGKVKKLALFEAPFVVDTSRPPIPADFAIQLDAMTRSGRQGAAITYFMTQGVGLPGIFVTMMRFMPAWSQLKATANTAPYDAACLRNNGAGKPLEPEQWAHVTMPTLVVAGGKSPTWMQHAMRALADTLPHAEHRALAGQMHIVKADAIAPVLSGFFHQQETSLER